MSKRKRHETEVRFDRAAGFIGAGERAREADAERSQSPSQRHVQLDAERIAVGDPSRVSLYDSCAEKISRSRSSAPATDDDTLERERHITRVAHACDANAREDVDGNLHRARHETALFKSTRSSPIHTITDEKRASEH